MVASDTSLNLIMCSVILRKTELKSGSKGMKKIVRDGFKSYNKRYRRGCKTPCYRTIPETYYPILIINPLRYLFQKPLFHTPISLHLLTRGCIP